MAIKIEKAPEIKKPARKSKPDADMTAPDPQKSKTIKKKTGRGGKRPGAGRKKGSENRASLSQKTNLSFLARQHTEVAIRTLSEICENGDSEAARVSAANALLDRGYGKPTQSHEHSGRNGGPIQTVDLTNATPEQLDALESIFGPLAECSDDAEGDQGGEGEA